MISERTKNTKPAIYQDNGVWYLSRYKDVKLFLSDARFSRTPPKGYGLVDQENGQTTLDSILNKWVLFSEPPEHTRLRQALNSILNPAFIKSTKMLIESITDDLLAKLLSERKVDFMSFFSFRLPIAVIKHLLGLTIPDETIRRWGMCVSFALDRGTAEDLYKVTADIAIMQDHFKKLMIERTQSPTDDWMSLLIGTKDQYHLSDEEIIASCILLLIAGHETMQLTLGLGLIALLKHPAQLKQLQNNSALIPPACEEIFRHCSPLMKLSRWTMEAVSFETLGVTIPKNQLVVGLIKEANYDPLRFENPNRFNILRENNRHLTFGYGIHQCLGALLARLELQIALKKLLPHMHKFSLIEQEMRWLPNASLNYIYHLPIEIN